MAIIYLIWQFSSLWCPIRALLICDNPFPYIITLYMQQLTITDNDLIEKSNLNRQFLFRPHHIQVWIYMLIRVGLFWMGQIL